jgi:hypothetical protein
MTAISQIPTRTFVCIALTLLACQALTLHLMGQPAIAAIGFRLWANDPLGPDNSQQLADWYSLSHIVHGLIFYGLTKLAAPRLPFAARLTLALGVEVCWEIAENTPFVIEAYRRQALAAGYRGDSIINSLSDSVMMMTGFTIASRLPWWASVILALILEGVAAVVIRDGLVLNILNFAGSWPALEHWQAGYRR